MKTFGQYLTEIEAHTGHLGTGGVQAHSAGPHFPMIIRCVGNSLQAIDGSTMKEGPKYPFNPGDSQSFYAAYAQAEADAKTMLNQL